VGEEAPRFAVPFLGSAGAVSWGSVPSASVRPSSPWATCPFLHTSKEKGFAPMVARGSNAAPFRGNHQGKALVLFGLSLDLSILSI